MLSELEAINLVKEYLLKNNCKIIESSGSIDMPSEKTKDDNYIGDNIATVSFSSDYSKDNPYYDILPACFIVFVNLETGDLHSPQRIEESDN